MLRKIFSTLFNMQLKAQANNRNFTIFPTFIKKIRKSQLLYVHLYCTYNWFFYFSKIFSQYWFYSMLYESMHCPKNNLNLRISKEPSVVTAGADATVYFWLLSGLQKLRRHILLHLAPAAVTDWGFCMQIIPLFFWDSVLCSSRCCVVCGLAVS